MPPRPCLPSTCRVPPLRRPPPRLSVALHPYLHLQAPTSLRFYQSRPRFWSSHHHSDCRCGALLHGLVAADWDGAVASLVGGLGRRQHLGKTTCVLRTCVRHPSRRATCPFAGPIREGADGPFRIIATPDRPVPAGFGTINRSVTSPVEPLTFEGADSFTEVCGRPAAAMRQT